MCDLSEADQAQLMKEIAQLSNIIRTLPGVEKLNVGNLGNMVTQLHVHVIGRRKGDPAWPGPVWGHSDPALGQAGRGPAGAGGPTVRDR